MAKNYNVGDLQPDELGELKRMVREYVSRLENLDNEIDTLRDDKKALKEEFEERLDIRTLNAVLRILKIESGVVHQDTYDTFYEALKADDLEDDQDPSQ
jgi:uncharacterized protein (UPF0335 family)